MIDAFELQRKEAEICRLAQVKFGVRATTVSQAMRRIGRRVPRRIQRRADVVARACRLAAHPKLSRQIDVIEVNAAYAEVTRHLAAVDAADRRLGRMLDIAATLAFNLIAMVIVILAVLAWRGLI